MDSDIIYSLSQFDKVWERVCSSEPTLARRPAEMEKPDTPETLRRLIEAEAESAEFYTYLASRCAGRFSGELKRLASEECSHIKRLALEYFLLTEKRYRPGKLCPRFCRLDSALYVARKRELELAEAYMSAAELTDDTSLRGLFLDLAECENAHAECLKKMLARLI